MAAFRQLPGTDIIIVTSAFEADFLEKPTQQIIITSAVVLVFSMLLGILYSAVFVRGVISNPLKKIEELLRWEGEQDMMAWLDSL